MVEQLRRLKPLAAAAGPEGIAAAELVDQLSKQVPEYMETARQVSSEILHAAGLTSQEDYEGWLPVMILLYVYLAPPVKLLYQIEIQTAGVLEQLYSWLGGAGKALDKGIQAIGSDVTGAWDAFVGGAEYVFSGRWL